MFKSLHYFKSWLLLMICMLVGGVGSAFAEDTPEVTLDFTSQSNWDIPTSGTNKTLASFTDGTYTIKLYSTTNYKMNNGYLILGKKDSYLELPAFSFDVEKIEIVGHSGASTYVGQNIYVGDVAVSTATTGADGVTNVYEIDADYQSASNVYKLMITTAHNTQIEYIKIYKKASSSPLASISVDATGATTTFHVGDAFTHEGATVTATYENETTADVTANATFSEPDMTTAGVKTVTVSYTENEVEKTTTYNITVNAAATLESITLSGDYPTEFEQGDAFSSEGIVVTANWSDQTTSNVSGDATFSGYDMTIVGEQTVTVIYGEQTANYTITVVEKKGTEDNPYTVTDALAATAANNVYVQGTISAITEVSTQYHNATYTISDGTSEMIIYRGKYLNNADFTAADQIAVGDFVKVYGNLQAYNNVNQMAQNNYIVSLVRPEKADLAFDQESYEVAILGALTITATSTNSDGAITYESSNEDVATIEYETGEVTALQAGTTTITATIAATAEYSGNTATVQLTVIDPRTPVVLSFTGVPETININETATYTATAEPLVEEITYESSDDNVVMVDENTGEIAALAVGTATITATFAGDPEHMEATASYTIQVIDPYAPTEKWVLVDPTDLQTGDIVAIVDQTSSKAMGNTGGTTAAPSATDVTLNADMDEITSVVGDDIQWEVTVSEETTTKSYQFGVAGTQNYLYTTTSNNGLRVGPSTTNNHNVCAIYDNDGVNYITIHDGAKTRYVGVYNSQDWRSYDNINNNIKYTVTAFYKKVSTLPVTITAAGAASFSSKYALDFSKVSELTAYKATSKSDSYVHLDEVEQVPAGAGVIVKGAEGTYNVPVVTGDVAELEGNLLVGTAEAEYTVGDDYGKVFKYVKRTSDGVVGFQKAKADWTCQVGHAYLKFSETQAREFIGIFGEDISTGIEAIDNSQLTIDNDAPAYNLAGQKVGKGYKGIVVKNGKKYVK